MRTKPPPEKVIALIDRCPHCGTWVNNAAETSDNLGQGTATAAICGGCAHIIVLTGLSGSRLMVANMTRALMEELPEEVVKELKEAFTKAHESRGHYG